MIKQLLMKQTPKFLLSIGDEGAVLVYMVGGQVEGRFFFNNTESIDIDKVFASDTEAPIYVMVDVSDQSYLQHSLPPVSSLNLPKMITRRLEKEFDRDDIKGAIFLNRAKTGRREWNYLFVSIRNVAPLSDWLEKLMAYPNLIAGIYLLPIESGSMLFAIKKAIEAENTATKSQWQMLIMHNKTGGLRQIVFRDGRILFTRLAQPVGGNAAGVIAGHIEQETLNIMEYIRRMNFEDSDTLDITIITPSDVKKQLEASRFKSTNLYVLTPYEVANFLGFEKAAEPKDKFSDVISLAFFGRNKKPPVLRLTTPILEKVRQTELLRIAVIIFTYCFVPLAVLLTLFNIYTSFAIKSRSEVTVAELEKVKSDQQSLEKRNAANAEKMTEVDAVVSLHEQYTADAVVPFGFFAKLSDLKGSIALFKQFEFKTSETANNKNQKTKAGSSINFVAKLDYPSTTLSPQDEIIALESFSKNFRESLPEFAVQFSGLPTQKDVQLSVEGGPTAAGAAPKAPVQKQALNIDLTIRAELNEELQKKYFMLTENETAPTPVAVPPTPQTKTTKKP